MPLDDKMLILLEKISEVSERTARIEERQTIMQQDVNSIKLEDAEQNRLLAEHIAGVRTNQARLDVEIENRRQLESRVDKLEEPSKFLITLKKYAIYIVVVGGALAAIIKNLPHH